MSSGAITIQCRMLCASGCAYGIDAEGIYTPPSPQTKAVDWIDSPMPFFGGELNINACLIGVNREDGIIVAFRGTLPPYPISVAGLADWLHDIVDSAPKQEGSIPGRVHDGFWDAIDTIWPQILVQIAYFHKTYPDKPLYFTGHSKGGAMACISAARIHFDHPAMLQPTAVYIYGSPRAGDSDFTKGFPLSTIPVTRYENCLDIAPLLPPAEIFIKLASRIPFLGDLFGRAKGWDYSPLGELQYIKDDLSIIENEPGLTLVRLAELVAATIEGDSRLDRIEKITKAHYVTCDYGYMNGICPKGVCE